MPIRTPAFALRDTEGNERDERLAVSNGDVAPVDIESGYLEQVVRVFEVPLAADPAELRWDFLDYISYVGETIIWVLHWRSCYGSP